MSFTNELAKQGREITPTLLSTYTLIVAGLVGIALISRHQDIPVAMFTRDPTIALGGGPFTGVVSNIGILFWCAAAALCFFCAFVLKHYRDAALARFLLASGLLTLMLLLDDLFMLHENVLPFYLRIPEKGVYLGYIAASFGYLIWYRDIIFKTDFTVLGIAGAFLASSMFTDVFLLQSGMMFLVEDGLKLAGIVTWCIYYARTCHAFIVNIPNKTKHEGAAEI